MSTDPDPDPAKWCQSERIRIHNTAEVSDTVYDEKKEVVVLLKVPSHQIRLTWKWYGWIDFHEYKNRGWYAEF